ncbi:HNH endonuclease family protein [Collimonas fungivorans]|uniref:HNH endonuclease family protein n=1 Tax=Collimonas fungivorans TaxID=158899 RepID=A0A127P8A5_9BURK|nr:HNH endonuclease signature motif containing protein [Collimonas fungivorans]AMO93997.1 HNH endonuclease family protein [Collimonas fungivorans]
MKTQKHGFFLSRVTITDIGYRQKRTIAEQVEPYLRFSNIQIIPSWEQNMRSIQEIFIGEFTDATLAVVQKLRPDDHNLEALESGFTENWPPLAMPTDVFILSLGEVGSKRRKIWAGFIEDIQPSTDYDKRFRFYVDRFRYIGEHDLEVVPDADFYGNGGGGGSRNYASNLRQIGKARPVLKSGDFDGKIPEGATERRLVWVRKNHHRFRDPVWRHWEGRCAVTGANCDGLLVASHIHPWAKCTPQEKTDPNNGLLLSVPLDKLFDRGWISFSDSGEILIKPLLSVQTRSIFGLPKATLRIGRMEKVSAEMQAYLKRHRVFHGFDKTIQSK